jgi:hypothetical protein
MPNFITRWERIPLESCCELRGGESVNVQQVLLKKKNRLLEQSL